MTRVLVTGFNARAASPRRATRDTCFAALLVECLRDCGYQVDHRDTSVAETLHDYAHIFVGVASPLAVSSNRTYPSLAALGRFWQTDRLTLFLDDPDVGKVVHGLASLMRKPEQFTKEFFATRMDYALATTDQWRSWLLEVAQVMYSSNWPRLLVPAWPWADQAKMLSALPVHMQHQALLIDLSNYMPMLVYPDHDRSDHWITEESFKSPWIRSLNLSLPVNHANRLNDGLRRMAYTEAMGVLEDAAGAVMYGWFRPRLRLAVDAGALYCTRWQAMTSAGTMFTMFPHAIEEMDPVAREDLVHEQKATLDRLTTTQEEARDLISGLITEPTAAEGAW